MANPTLYYNWTLPYEGQDPWHAQLEDSFDAVDTTIHSVSLIARPRSTLVYSLVPEAAMYIDSGTAADGVWTICSVQPYGRIVGSFSTVGSGAHIALTLQAAPYAHSSVVSLFSTTIGAIRVRLVGGKTGASSMVFTGNSTWLFGFMDTMNRHQMVCHAVMSVGIGQFSVEMQARYQPVTDLHTVSSRGVFGIMAPIFLYAAEMTPG